MVCLSLLAAMAASASAATVPGDVVATTAAVQDSVAPAATQPVHDAVGQGTPDLAEPVRTVVAEPTEAAPKLPSAPDAGAAAGQAAGTVRDTVDSVARSAPEVAVNAPQTDRIVGPAVTTIERAGGTPAESLETLAPTSTDAALEPVLGLLERAALEALPLAEGLLVQPTALFELDLQAQVEGMTTAPGSGLVTQVAIDRTGELADRSPYLAVLDARQSARVATARDAAATAVPARLAAGLWGAGTAVGTPAGGSPAAQHGAPHYSPPVPSSAFAGASAGTAALFIATLAIFTLLAGMLIRPNLGRTDIAPPVPFVALLERPG